MRARRSVCVPTLTMRVVRDCVGVWRHSGGDFEALGSLQSDHCAGEVPACSSEHGFGRSCRGVQLRSVQAKCVSGIADGQWRNGEL